jgi:hypothetical protein
MILMIGHNFDVMWCDMRFIIRTYIHEYINKWHIYIIIYCLLWYDHWVKKIKSILMMGRTD